MPIIFAVIASHFGQTSIWVSYTWSLCLPFTHSPFASPSSRIGLNWAVNLFLSPWFWLCIYASHFLVFRNCTFSSSSRNCFPSSFQPYFNFPTHSFQGALPGLLRHPPLRPLYPTVFRQWHIFHSENQILLLRMSLRPSGPVTHNFFSGSFEQKLIWNPKVMMDKMNKMRE